MHVFAIIGLLLCLGVISYSFIDKSKNLEKREKERFCKKRREKKENEKQK